MGSYKFSNDINISNLVLMLIYSHLLPLNIFFGLRPSHVVTYILFFLTIYQALNRKAFKIPSVFFLTFFFSTLILIVASFSSLRNNLSLVDNINAFNNLIAPLLVLTIFSGFLNNPIRIELIRKIQNHIVFLVLVNSIIALISIFLDFSIVYQFIQGSETSVLIRSYNLGRYLGFFLQPFEAGVIYILGTYYALELKFNWKISLLIIISGILTHSKVYYLFLPLLVFLKLNFRWRVILFAPIVSLLIGVMITYHSEVYSYILEPRFGIRSDFGQIVSYIVRDNFFAGLGVVSNPFDSPVDSSYLHIFVTSGLFGLFTYCLIMVYLFFNNIVLWGFKNGSILLFFLLFLCALAGPVFFSFNLSFFVLFAVYKERILGS